MLILRSRGEEMSPCLRFRKGGRARNQSLLKGEEAGKRSIFLIGITIFSALRHEGEITVIRARYMYIIFKKIKNMLMA